MAPMCRRPNIQMNKRDRIFGSMLDRICWCQSVLAPCSGISLARASDPNADIGISNYLLTVLLHNTILRKNHDVSPTSLMVAGQNRPKEGNKIKIG